MSDRRAQDALVLAGIDPPKTHDLNALRNLAPDGWRVGRRKQDLTRLTSYAVESRYPDDIGPVTSIQAATAVRQAMAVLREVQEDFERNGVSTTHLDPR